MKKLLAITTITVLSTLLGFGVLYLYGRSLWHPILVKRQGGQSVDDVTTAIKAKKPHLSTLTKGLHLTIVAFKSDRLMEVHYGGVKIGEYPILAASGTIGPKLKEGDRQVPEGFYGVDVLNPNSSYHLSLRVTYPNQTDIERSRAKGISDYGGDIYIHGKSVSIGCLAIGDEAIEDVFFIAYLAGLGNISVIIAPSKSPIGAAHPDTARLYRAIYEKIEAFTSTQHDDLHETAPPGH